MWMTGKCGEAKEEFDEQRKLPHNLISSLLTNKTICRKAARHRSARAYRTSSLKINSR
jgi:hypothetical protein